MTSVKILDDISSVWFYLMFLCSELMSVAFSSDAGVFQGCWKSPGWVVWFVSVLPPELGCVARNWIIDTNCTQAPYCCQLRDLPTGILKPVSQGQCDPGLVFGHTGSSVPQTSLSVKDTGGALGRYFSHLHLSHP